VTWVDFLPGERFFFPRAQPQGRKFSQGQKIVTRAFKKAGQKMTYFSPK
jgi:hypothetical protein